MKIHPFQLLVASILCSALAWSAHAQDCEPQWSPLGSGLSGRVWALTVFNDGSGPALYAGGDFTSASGLTVNNVAKWDGNAWSALSGPGGAGVTHTAIPASVRSLCVFDDGSGPALYVGGYFTSAAGTPASGIAKWDGNAWSRVIGQGGQGLGYGGGAGPAVWAMTVFDDGYGPALYAGGPFSFVAAGGVTANYIARWNGTQWSALGTGTSSIIYALSVFDNGSGADLYAGGDFASAGGLPAAGIARWNGSVWSGLPALSGGPGGNVRALTAFEQAGKSELFVGGGFTASEGVTFNGIAAWDGSTWSALSDPGGTGVTSGAVVRALAVFDNGLGSAVYAAGDFETASSLTVNGIAKWNGNQWSALTDPSGTGVSGFQPTVRALAVFDDGSGSALYLGGDFPTAGGITANYIARWTCTPPCLADLDDNGTLNFFDIAAFLTFYQLQFPIADWNGDGVLNFFDFAGYLDAYNTGCP